jgi:hypothetical protein
MPKIELTEDERATLADVARESPRRPVPPSFLALIGSVARLYAPPTAWAFQDIQQIHLDAGPRPAPEETLVLQDTHLLRARGGRYSTGSRYRPPADGVLGRGTRRLIPSPGEPVKRQ